MTQGKADPALPPDANPLAISCGAVCAIVTTDGRFSAWQPPEPAITSVQPSSGSEAGADAYTRNGLAPPAPVRIEGHGFRFASGQASFGTVPAGNVHVLSDTLIEVQPPPGRVGPIDLHLSGLAATTPSRPTDLYTYHPTSTSVTLAGPLSVTGTKDGPAAVTASLVVTGDPLDTTQLTWNSGPSSGKVAIGPFAPGRHPIRIAVRFIAHGDVSAGGSTAYVCLAGAGSTVDNCSSGPLQVLPGPGLRWWDWALFALAVAGAGLIGAALGRRARRRGRAAATGA